MKNIMDKTELLDYMDDLLKIGNFEDNSANWLQVANEKKKIKKIWYAVDASSYIFEKAVKKNIDLLIVHHGLFWGREQTITGLFYEKIKILIENEIALFACHLPLDAHKELWNNAQLAKLWIDFFELEDYKIEKAVDYHNVDIGFAVVGQEWISIKKISKFCKKYGLQDVIYNFGDKKEVYSVMFGSGGCGDAVAEAKQKWYDLFLLWELAHQNVVNAKELWQSLLVGGHYETEIFGVKALAKHLEKKFGIEIVFLDEKAE